MAKLKGARGYSGNFDSIMERVTLLPAYFLYTLWKRKDISSWQFPFLFLYISSVLYLKCLLDVIKGNILSQTFVKNGLFKLLVKLKK